LNSFGIRAHRAGIIVAFPIWQANLKGAPMIATSARIHVSLGLLGSMLLVALHLDVSWVANLNEFGNLPQYLETLKSEFQRHDRLEAKGEATRQRVQAKQRIVRAMLEGQLSLHEAAVQFREIALKTPYLWDHYQGTQPTWSEQRRLYQYVIDLAAEVLMADGRDPSAKVSELTKLANEYQ
jgi:hypothetical protein